MKENPTRPKQYNLIDAMRLIAAFFVVTIHVPFPGDFGNIVIVVARFAVPFFFAVSGFFSYYEDFDLFSLKIKKKLVHIFKLFLSTVLLYLGFHLIYRFVIKIPDDAPIDYLRSIFSFKSIIEFFMFNHTSVAEFTWFLSALIYSYILFFILLKFKYTKAGGGKNTKIYLLLFVFLSICGILLREIPEYLNKIPKFMCNAFLYRNFLFVGFPFFLMGYFIRVNLENIIFKSSTPILVILMFLGTCESILVGTFHATKIIYLGTIVSVFALFIFIVKLENKAKVPHLSVWGQKYSLYIYIFHIIINSLLEKLETAIPFYGKIFEFLNPVRPIVIFAITLTVSAVYVYIKNSFKKVKIRSEK